WPHTVWRRMTSVMVTPYCAQGRPHRVGWRLQEYGVEAWLSSIGLAERAAALRADRLTPDQLPELTDDDLRELGLPIGERKRFRRAVAALRPTAPEDPPPAALPVLETTRAERRPLTIMFVDMVNSSHLGERLEPEDLLEVIRRYHAVC